MATVQQLKSISAKIQQGQQLTTQESFIYQKDIKQFERIQREKQREAERRYREEQQYYYVGERKFHKGEYEIMGRDDDTPRT